MRVYEITEQNFHSLLEEGMVRFYKLPLSPWNSPKCNYFEAIGSKNTKNRTLLEVEECIKKANSGPCSAFLLPTNLFSFAQRRVVVERLQAAEYPVVVEIPAEARLWPEIAAEIEWLVRSGCFINYVFDDWTDSDAEFVERLAKSFGEKLYFTLVGCIKVDTQSLVLRLPKAVQDQLYFYFPFKHSGSRNQYYDALGIQRAISLVRDVLPGFRFRPPPGLDIFEPRIPDDRNLEGIVEPGFEFQAENSRIDVSIIIPTYNNRGYVLNVLRHLFQQDIPCEEYEVVLVDDGSNDGTKWAVEHFFRHFNRPINFKYLHFPRIKPRKMGDNQFRAGVARNVGVKAAAGDILAFLDSDMLVPPHYIRDLRKKLDHYEVIQGRRIHLKRSVSSRYTDFSEIEVGRDNYISDDGYWHEFQKTLDWGGIERKWRYVCTHSLSIRRSTFEAIGGFKKNYIFYGYEDTEIGFDLSRMGCRFLLNDTEVYHLDHRNNRSEFFKSHRKKRLLLKESATTFYHNTLDDGIFRHLEWLFWPMLGIRIAISDVLNGHYIGHGLAMKAYYLVANKLKYGTGVGKKLLLLLLSPYFAFSFLRKKIFTREKFYPFFKVYYFLHYHLTKRVLKVKPEESQ